MKDLLFDLSKSLKAFIDILKDNNIIKDNKYYVAGFDFVCKNKDININNMIIKERK